VIVYLTPSLLVEESSKCYNPFLAAPYKLFQISTLSETGVQESIESKRDQAPELRTGVSKDGLQT